MFVNYFFLFTIISITGSYLGNVECVTREEFFKFEKTYLSGEGTPSTIFTTSNYTMKNIMCFMALLRHIVMYTGIDPPISNRKDDQKKFVARLTGYEFYRTYVLTNIHLLDMELYTSFKPQIAAIFSMLRDWKMDTKINPKLQKSVQALIEAGYQQNKWHLEREYITERSAENFDFEYKKDTSFFYECRSMYREFDYGQSFLDVLENALININSYLRIELYKTIPIIMKDGIQQITDQFDKKTHLSQNVLNNTLKYITQYYDDVLVEMISRLTNLLCTAADRKSYTTVKTWDSDANQIYANILHLHINITKAAKEKIDLLCYNLETLKKYSPNYTSENLEFKNINTLKTAYTTQLNNVYSTGNCKDHTPRDNKINLDRMWLLPYYENYRRFPNQFSDNFMKPLLNLQAWISIAMLNLEQTIAVARNMGIKEKVTVTGKKSRNAVP